MGSIHHLKLMCHEWKRKKTLLVCYCFLLFCFPKKSTNIENTENKLMSALSKEENQFCVCYVVQTELYLQYRRCISMNYTYWGYVLSKAL